MVTTDEVCEAVAARLKDELGDAVAIEWGFSIRHDETKDTGRRIDIYPDPEGLSQAPLRTRAGDSWDHAVLITVWQVCPKNQRNPADSLTLPPGLPTRDWMRDSMRWGLKNVFRRISEEREDETWRIVVKDFDTGDEVELWPQEATVIAQYDPTAEERGVFMAEYRIVFREQE